MYKKVMFLFCAMFIAATIVPAQNPDLKELLKQELGKKIFFDKISSPDWMSCSTCHDPKVGFTGPIPGTNLSTAIYRGAVPQRFGNRKPPSAAYATFSPVFYYDENEELFGGGNFWDGNATGERLGNPAAEQALGPFLNPLEQNNASKQDVLMQIAESKYAYLWEEVWDEPIAYETPEEVDINYDRVGLAIAAYEGSEEVNQFSSKYDLYLAGDLELNEEEAWGLELFEGKAQCSACHPSEPGPNGEPPLFTDFTFDNLGVPKNPDNPYYDLDEVCLPNGDPINPLGEDWIDPGLGGFLSTRPEWAGMAGENMGKHKVPTLRNVAKAPSDKFLKAYMHNGVFKTLEEVVHFYNTRDVGDWPPPEVADNVNTDELGDLVLTDDEEAAIVAFMKTLSDGYIRVKDKGKEKSAATLKISGANPFNPTTRFTYSILQATDVQIHVFNTLGQKVATLIDSYQPAGSYEIEFDASHLASGVYFVRLSAQDMVQTKRISLIK